MLFTSIILAATAAISVSAAPAHSKRQNAPFTSINAITSPGLTQPPVSEPIPMQFNVLTTLDNLEVSSLALDEGATGNVVSIEMVECQAYSDVTGFVPAGLPLNWQSTPIQLTTQLVEINSILCYLKEAPEME